MNFNRRNFLKYSALFFTAAAISPSQAFSLHDFSNQKDDLHLLVLGDSIMWGQGLLDEQKFWFITKQWLESGTGRTVVPRVEAHSGATILWRNDQKYPTDRLSTFNGELNISTPTILQQVKNAAAHYGNKKQEVDLILVDGGINDIGVFNLVNPLKSTGWVEKRCRRIFGQDMTQLLEEVEKSFNNARIVVTGYYPIVSTDTPRDHLCSLLQAILNEKIVKKIPRIFNPKKKVLDLCSLNFVKENFDKIIGRLSLLSEVWAERSNLYLEQTVEEINKKYPLTGAADNKRVIFVKIPFGSKNAYGATDTYLWQITGGGNIFGSYKSNDAFYNLRGEYACRCNHIKLKGFNLEKCAIAGTGHPNVSGASVYAAAVQKELGKVLELSR